jgi:hypothetical protein
MNAWMSKVNAASGASGDQSTSPARASTLPTSVEGPRSEEPKKRGFFTLGKKKYDTIIIIRLGVDSLNSVVLLNVNHRRRLVKFDLSRPRCHHLFVSPSSSRLNSVLTSHFALLCEVSTWGSFGD